MVDKFLNATTRSGKYRPHNEMNRWTKASILIVITGVILITINRVYYVPKFNAFTHALWSWSKNETGTAAPSPETFGLDATSPWISTLLGGFGSLLVFVGALWLATLLITKIHGRFSSKT